MGFGLTLRKKWEKTNENGKKKQQLMFKQEVQKQLLPKKNLLSLYHIN